MKLLDIPLHKRYGDHAEFADLLLVLLLRERSIVNMKLLVAQARATVAILTSGAINAVNEVGGILAVTAGDAAKKSVGLRTFVAPLATDKIEAIDAIR
jgi:hypothetical protein